MMTLVNSYLPVFRFITAFFLHPRAHADYAVFREQCLSLLRHSREASERQHAPEECDDAFFAVVLWLDERVLCSTAPWVKKWQGELLQSHYFNISVGGEIFYTRLDDIDPANIPLRMVYLFCLLNGFHGKYTGQEARLLQQRIDNERQCLPGAWRSWPNDAPLVEQSLRYDQGNTRKRKAFRHNHVFLF
ncbi:DotU family type IV/VI secretion system protein, partial [Serratia marcescens]|uniref:DotU family type IV/VI secretion system protein n=1 Tax=Serratia marcescens TaxID=615 RepID=UPI0011E6C7AF